MPNSGLVVCVPARDEADHLLVLLNALACQTIDDFRVIITINNTKDASLERVIEFRAKHPRLEIIVDEITFADVDAHAGSARRRAMDLAADIAGPNGFVLTTDADTRPPADWLENNLAAMNRGLDVAGGKIVLDEAAPLPPIVAVKQRIADQYWVCVRQIEDEIDPVPWDPPPRHGDHTGASLCMRVALYHRCGGCPPLKTGEDRALVQAAVRHGGRLAHPIKIWTRVSPRIKGRAQGGMADHMARLHERCRTGQVCVLPSFLQWRRRAEWRRDVRRQGGAALIAEREDRLPPMIDDFVLDQDALELLV